MKLYRHVAITCQISRFHRFIRRKCCSNFDCRNPCTISLSQRPGEWDQNDTEMRQAPQNEDLSRATSFVSAVFATEVLMSLMLSRSLCLSLSLFCSLFSLSLFPHILSRSFDSFWRRFLRRSSPPPRQSRAKPSKSSRQIPAKKLAGSQRDMFCFRL